MHLRSQMAHSPSSPTYPPKQFAMPREDGFRVFRAEIVSSYC
jgi:hypothetical protein